MSTFYVSAGWLHYAPFRDYALPELTTDDEVAEMERRRPPGGPEYAPAPERRIYRLRWPGKTYRAYEGSGAAIPKSVARRWPKVGSVALDGAELQVVEVGDMPAEPPDSVAYHLAVNAPAGSMPPFHVAGLTRAVVQEVLDVEFAIDADYLGAARYLQWLAETHRHHPLFRHFDTAVRDTLTLLSVKAAALYFYLLGDCIYDRESKWWKHDARKRFWPYFAHYLHVVGRTGQGLYAYESGLDKQVEAIAKAREPKDGPPLYFGLCNRLDAWCDRAMRESRKNSRIDGRDPCACDEDEDAAPASSTTGGEPSGPASAS